MESVSHSVVSNSFVIPWTIACQAPLSLDFPGKNTGVGCHSLLQGIFPTQGLNSGLLHCRQILYHLSHQGSPLGYESLLDIKSTWNKREKNKLDFIKIKTFILQKISPENENTAHRRVGSSFKSYIQ